MKLRSLIFVLSLFICLPYNLAASPAKITEKPLALSKNQQRMLSDLEFIKNAFAVKYAPALWKKEYCGWDLPQAYEKARQAILAKPNMTQKEYHILLKRFFLDVRDYHVAVTFFSTEQANLPFLVKKAEERYIVIYIDQARMPWSLFNNLEEGDEVVLFNGEPIDQVVKKLLTQEMGNNSAQTDQSIAELMLTHRSGTRGDVVPQGSVDIEVIKASSARKERYRLEWDYQGEKIRDFAKIDVLTAVALPYKSKKRPKPPKTGGFFNKMMVYPYWEGFFAHDEIPHGLGSRKSCVPVLGDKTWEVDESCCFDAYIFKVPQGYAKAGSKIGYIRIPTYMCDKDEAEEFKELIQLMQMRTEALVIDQINNPGGSLFYLYALASMLTDKPLTAPKHHIALTQQEVHMAFSMLDQIESVVDDVSAKEFIGEDVGGYEIDFTFSVALKQFCDLLIDEWNAGNFYTKPTHLFGIDLVQPHREVRYTKPILVLINSLDFSGGDFFPAILQDNKRATLFGSRTAGAGGYVLQNSFPNFSAIAGFSVTASLAERSNREPLENLGVKPDICYEFSVRDLREGFCEYAHNILTALDGVIR
jgi:hypothetical protein